jgi:chromosome segregation ATPase|tara:strand:+ start:4286 stop:4474 length:189 start_codon:yes stop_codon:yes gene_type:complete
MAEEENNEEVDLGEKLEKLVEEIKEVMERRKERIAELRAEIERIEQDNVSLENTIGELLKGF